MGLFRALILILFSALFFYVSHQLTRFADLSLPLTLLILAWMTMVFGLILAMPFFMLSGARKKHQSWHDLYMALTHLALGYINFLAVFVILRDILAFATHVANPEFDSQIWYSATVTLALLILPVILIFLGSLVILSGPRRKKVPLRFKDLPLDLEGLRILHITDLHISRSLPTKFILKLIETCKKDPADLVVFTGDILDDEPKRFAADVKLLNQIPNRLGSFYVPGNHEYYWEGAHTIQAFRDLGFQVLTNECHSLKIGGSEMQICGIPDPAARMFSLEAPDFKKMGSALKSDAFKVLLSHQPSLADQAAPLGIHLQLSGHTHGGQFFPWNLLIGLFQKYGKGRYQIENLQLYVNQGTGYWGPKLRLGTYCEVAEIVLHKA